MNRNWYWRLILNQTTLCFGPVLVARMPFVFLWFLRLFSCVGHEAADLQEALHVAGRVLRPGPVVPVRQQDHHPVLQQPLGFTWGHSRTSDVLTLLYRREKTKGEGGGVWGLPPERKVSKMICAPLKKSPNWASQMGSSLGWAMLIPYSKPSTASSDSGLLHTWNKQTAIIVMMSSCELDLAPVWDSVPPGSRSAPGWCGSEGCACRWSPGTPAWRVSGWTCLGPRPGHWCGCWSLREAQVHFLTSSDFTFW